MAQGWRSGNPVLHWGQRGSDDGAAASASSSIEEIARFPRGTAAQAVILAFCCFAYGVAASTGSID